LINLLIESLTAHFNRKIVLRLKIECICRQKYWADSGPPALFKKSHLAESIGIP